MFWNNGGKRTFGLPCMFLRIVAKNCAWVGVRPPLVDMLKTAKNLFGLLLMT